MVNIEDIPTSLAWSFTHLLPGTFKRKKKEYARHDYPILAPLPTAKAKTLPLELISGAGPFIYFVVDASTRLCYVGKSQEKCVLKRWIRPGIGGPTSHYWTHSTTGGGSVFNIAEGLRQAKGPYKLQVTSLESLLSKFGEQLRIDSSMPEEAVLTVIESYLIRELRPIWNH